MVEAPVKRLQVIGPVAAPRRKKRLAHLIGIGEATVAQIAYKA